MDRRVRAIRVSREGAVAVGVAVALVAARLRHARGRWWIVAAALAAGAAVPVLVAGSAAVTADAAMRRGVDALPVGERSVTVSYNGLLDDAEAAAADDEVRRHLPALAGGPVRRQLVFRPISDGAGVTFTLGATDGLAAAVRLVDGRLPSSCTPTRCEVVAVMPPGGDVAEPRPPPQLGLVIVGHARRLDPFLLSGTFDPGPASPLLLADGVDAAARLAALTVFQRSYGWVTALDLRPVRRLGVHGWVAAGADIADDLTRAREGLVLTTPDDVLATEDARARASSRRFALLGGTAAVLLLGAAVAGGAALRQDHGSFAGALQRRGIARRTLAAIVAGEVAATALAGAVAGLALGAGATAVLAARGGLPVLATARDAAVAGIPAVAALSLAAAVLLAVTLRRAAGRPGADGAAWRAVSLASFGCVAVAGLLAARGGVGVAGAGDGTGSGSGSGAGSASDTADPLLPLLPALVLLAGGLLAARGWPLLARAAGRWLPRRAVAARLGVGAVAGQPLRAAATVALLAAAVGAAVFAGSYRATLERGSSDQAAFAVPTSARIMPGPQGDRPLAVAAPATLAATSPGGEAFGVLRLAGSMRVASVQADPIQFVGLDPEALSRTARWRAVTGGPAAAQVAEAIAVEDVPGGVALPLGRQLRIETPGTPARVAVTAWVRSPDGRERGVPLGVVPAAGNRSAALSGQLPELGGPLHLVSLQLREPTDDATRRQHSLGEALRDLAAPTGTLRFGAMTVDGRQVRGPWTGWAGRGLSVTPEAAVLRYVLRGDSPVLDARPGGPGADVPLLVAADPRTAAEGNVTLTLGGAAVPVRVVATLPRFPTVSGRFVVADREALARVAGRTTPGAGDPGEVWLAVPRDGERAARAAFARAPLARLGLTWRADVERSLRTDPVARGAVALLVAGTALTLGVALAALVLLVVTSRYDDAGELYAWEADGVPPGTLRAALWWRAAAVAAVAVPAGVAVGLLLARLTALLVGVTAGALDPQPPLVAGTGAGDALLTVAAGLAVALAVAGLVAARSLREPLPVLARVTS